MQTRDVRPEMLDRRLERGDVRQTGDLRQTGDVKQTGDLRKIEDVTDRRH